MKLKKLLSGLITAAMVLTLIPMFTLSVNAFSSASALQTAINNSRDNVLTTLTITNGFILNTQITIPANKHIRIASVGTPCTIERGTTGTLFTVSGNGARLHLHNIVVDGGRNGFYGIDGGGPLVLVSHGGTFTMETGAVLRNNIGGGVAADNLGTFNMTGGTISNNSRRTGDGGGVVVFNSTFTMSGGVISGNTAHIGGGVRIEQGLPGMNNGRFVMSGSASIRNNTADFAGGGISVGTNNNGFTMNGGEIRNNRVTSTGNAFREGFGGGVDVIGSFTMNGGTITGNSANRGGGGVRVGDIGTFTMNGGTITQNTANASPGVHTENSGVFNYNGGTVDNYIRVNLTPREILNGIERMYEVYELCAGRCGGQHLDLLVSGFMGLSKIRNDFAQVIKWIPVIQFGLGIFPGPGGPGITDIPLWLVLDSKNWTQDTINIINTYNTLVKTAIEHANQAAQLMYFDCRLIANNPWLWSVPIQGAANPAQSNANNIIINAKCPVDISISLNGEELNSATNNLTASFGSMIVTDVFDGKHIYAVLDYNESYIFHVFGTDNGTMELSISYDTDDNIRQFLGIEITENTVISSSSFHSETELTLFVSRDDGDTIDEIWVTEFELTTQPTHTFMPIDPEEFVYSTISTLTWDTIGGVNISETYVTSDLTLPFLETDFFNVSWQSDISDIISNNGIVTRPTLGSGNATVILTVTVEYKGISDTKEFIITVIETPPTLCIHCDNDPCNNSNPSCADYVTPPEPCEDCGKEPCECVTPPESCEDCEKEPCECSTGGGTDGNSGGGSSGGFGGGFGGGGGGSAPAPAPALKTEPEPEPEPTPEYVYEIEDALEILRYEVGLIALTAQQYRRYDLNNDGRVDLDDAIYVLRIVAGLIEQ